MLNGGGIFDPYIGPEHIQDGALFVGQPVPVHNALERAALDREGRHAADQITKALIVRLPVFVS